MLPSQAAAHAARQFLLGTRQSLWVQLCRTQYIATCTSRRHQPWLLDKLQQLTCSAAVSNSSSSITSSSARITSSSSSSSSHNLLGWSSGLLQLNSRGASLKSKLLTHLAGLQAVTAAYLGPTAHLSLAAAAAAPTPSQHSAAAAAAVPAPSPSSSILGYFQGTRYRGDSLLPSGRYWLRQFGFEGSPLTPFLVAGTVGAYGMQCVSPTFQSFCIRVGYKVAAGEYWRLLTPILVHGNLIHVMVNTFALWNLGRYTEPRLGSSTFLTVYLGSGVAGNTLSYLMSPRYTVALGSSTALFGLMGALSMAALRGHLSRYEISSIAQTLALNAVLMVAFGGSMDIWGHVGGFLGGAAILGVMGPRRRGYNW